MRNENERAEFEKVVREDHGHLSLLVRDDGKYANLYTQSMFDLWCHARSRSGAVPAGYALVPIEPTQWMRTQGDEGFESGSFLELWRRVLAAAPGPQQGEHVRVTDELPAPSSGEQAAAAPRRIRQPIQPLYVCPVDGRLRFQPNAIVQHLLDHGGIDMNALARLDFPRGDREQFAQLIGYSHDGYGTLSYATDRVYDKALERYERRQARAQASEPVSATAAAPVAHVHICAASVDLCPISGVTRGLRASLGDGTHPLFASPAASFQQRVKPWLLQCFGAEIAADRVERNHRFTEEALELVQSNGMLREDAHALVEYVYNRPAGELPQEVGGVMVTLAALCLASGADMHAAGETELARISAPGVVEKIRAKQAAKPRGSALPVYVSAPADAREGDAEDARRYRWLRGKFYLIGSADGSRKFNVIGLPRPVGSTPDPESCPDAAIDSAMGAGGSA